MKFLINSLFFLGILGYLGFSLIISTSCIKKIKIEPDPTSGGSSVGMILVDPWLNEFDSDFPLPEIYTPSGICWDKTIIFPINGVSNTTGPDAPACFQSLTGGFSASGLLDDQTGEDEGVLNIRVRGDQGYDNTNSYTNSDLNPNCDPVLVIVPLDQAFTVTVTFIERCCNINGSRRLVWNSKPDDPFLSLSSNAGITMAAYGADPSSAWTATAELVPTGVNTEYCN